MGKVNKVDSTINKYVKIDDEILQILVIWKYAQEFFFTMKRKQSYDLKSVMKEIGQENVQLSFNYSSLNQ